MTLIQPNKINTLWSWILFCLIGMTTVAVFGLIFLYNETVDLAHGVTVFREETKLIESRNSELKGDIFSLFNPVRVSAFADSRGMVTEQSPDYAHITKEWVAASHF